MNQQLLKNREAIELMGKLEDENRSNVLNAINSIQEIPNLTGDDELKELKEYPVMRSTLKNLYVATARALINIFNEDADFSCDEVNSFNYVEPLEVMLAAKYIKLLPKAFIGGPIKAALSHPYHKVQKIAVDYFDSLPDDLKYSDIFPTNFRSSVRVIRNQLST